MLADSNVAGLGVCLPFLTAHPSSLTNNFNFEVRQIFVYRVRFFTYSLGLSVNFHISNSAKFEVYSNINENSLKQFETALCRSLFQMGCNLTQSKRCAKALPQLPWLRCASALVLESCATSFTASAFIGNYCWYPKPKDNFCTASN